MDSNLKFGLGQPIRRREDERLLTGKGVYTDDVNIAGQAHAYIVRSRYAHGTIRKVDVAAARKQPGVLGAYSAADLAAAGVNPIKCGMMVQGRDGKPWLTPPRPVLAGEKVRFSGEAVALVVAETLAQAKDAAEAVEVEIDPLPPAPTSTQLPPLGLMGSGRELLERFEFPRVESLLPPGGFESKIGVLELEPLEFQARLAFLFTLARAAVRKFCLIQQLTERLARCASSKPVMTNRLTSAAVLVL